MVKTYDPKSYELAQRFLEDYPHRDGIERLEDDLAKHIQQAIEDWFEDKRRHAA